MIKLRTAPAARSDIRDIRAYSKATFGKRVARDYLDGLIAAFDRLAMNPFIGVVERDLGKDIRSFAYRSHRIFYRVDENELLVVRILHHARDFPAAWGRSQ